MVGEVLKLRSEEQVEQGISQGMLEITIDMVHNGELAMADGTARLGIAIQHLAEAVRKIYTNFSSLS